MAKQYPEGKENLERDRKYTAVHEMEPEKKACRWMQNSTILCFIVSDCFPTSIKYQTYQSKT